MLVIFNGKRLREERRSRGIPQAALAISTDSTIRYIRALESGEKSNPSAVLVCKICDVLELPMETFMQVKHDESDER